MFNRKINYQAFFAIGFMLLSLPACRKDNETFDPYTNSQKELDALLSSVPSTLTTTVFTLRGSDLVNDTMLATPGGVRLKLENNDVLFTLENNTAQPCTSCNTVKVEITEVLRPGDWLSRGMPTVNQSAELLEHIGAVRVKISCDAKNLLIANSRHLKLYIPDSSNGTNYTIAYAQPDAQQKLTAWENGEANSVYNATWTVAGSVSSYEGYQLLTKKLGWVSAIRPLAPNASITFCVKLPKQYYLDNTRVFALLEDGTVTVQMQPKIDEKGVFCLDNAPMGEDIRFVTVSSTGSHFWLGNGEAVVSDMAPSSVSPVISDQQSIITFLRGL
jgi:hypothetical protein